jgi:shikimate kinase
MTDERPNLVLIGFMASGKSTIGRICAARLGFKFYDSDRLVERRAGCTIAKLFEERGEPAFREMEVEAIRSLSRYRNVVIATGGGAPMNGLNIARLRQRGIIILLSTTPQEILQRVPDRASRPLLAGATEPEAKIQDLMSQRKAAYCAAAHAIVETTGLAREAAADAVLQEYHRLAAKWKPPARRNPSL